VVGCWDDIREVKRLFIRDTIRDLEKIGVAEWAADIFSLAACEATSEMRVSEQASKGFAVEFLLYG
jgi:hypothetical protein